MTDLATIEQSTAKFAEAHANLVDMARELDAQINQIKLQFQKDIRRGAARVADLRAQLESLIDANRGLFEQRRTHVMFGIKVGIVKGKGALTIEDPDRTVELIKKHFPDRYEELVRTNPKPDREAINKLAVYELRKIGCDIEDASDHVLIKPMDGDTEKLVKAILAACGKEDA